MSTHELVPVAVRLISPLALLLGLCINIAGLPPLFIALIAMVLLAKMALLIKTP